MDAAPPLCRARSPDLDLASYEKNGHGGMARDRPSPYDENGHDGMARDRPSPYDSDEFRL